MIVPGVRIRLDGGLMLRLRLGLGFGFVLGGTERVAEQRGGEANGQQRGKPPAQAGENL